MLSIKQTINRDLTELRDEVICNIENTKSTNVESEMLLVIADLAALALGNICENDLNAFFVSRMCDLKNEIS